jgi:hypothetical protein
MWFAPVPPHTTLEPAFSLETGSASMNQVRNAEPLVYSLETGFSQTDLPPRRSLRKMPRLFNLPLRTIRMPNLCYVFLYYIGHQH